jgi:hypothetical protein
MMRMSMCPPFWQRFLFMFGGEDGEIGQWAVGAK